MHLPKSEWRDETAFQIVFSTFALESQHTGISSVPVVTSSHPRPATLVDATVVGLIFFFGWGGGGVIGGEVEGRDTVEEGREGCAE